MRSWIVIVACVLLQRIQTIELD